MGHRIPPSPHASKEEWARYVRDINRLHAWLWRGVAIIIAAFLTALALL